MQTAYEILGVAKTGSPDEIKSAYRKLAKKFHPDLNPGNKEAEKKFKEINQANEEIGTPEARAKYDLGETENAQARNYAGAESRRGRGSPNQDYYYQTQGGGQGAGSQGRYSSAFGGMDEDLFSSIFGGAGGRGGAQGFGGAGARAAPNETYQMEIEFKDSILGGEREITLPTGKRLAIKIPAGIEAGKKLRFGGQAEGGGDVYVEIKVKPSDRFTRVGNHVEIEVPISVSEALLAGEIKVPTLDGSILLKVPAGVSSGQKLRVAGKGVPAHGKEAAGDERVILKIVTPKTIDAEFKAAVEAWQQRQPFSPREGAST
jgi:DnaJ-class molecular chaperone